MFHALQSSGRSAHAWHYALLLAWLWTPILAVVAISAWRPSFVERYLIVSLPALVLIAGAALDAIPRAWLRYAMVAAMLALTAWGIPSAYRPSFFPNVTEEDYRSAIAFLTSHARPEDGVFFYVAPGRAAYDYYTWLRPPSAAPRVLYPAHGPGRQYQDLIAEPLAELPSVPAGTPRVWLLLSGYRDSAGRPDRGSVIVLSWLQRRLQLTEVYNFAGVELLLFEAQQ